MIKISWSLEFSKKLKKWIKKHPDLASKFEATLNKFVHNPDTPSLRKHRLTGKLKNFQACCINYEQRLIFKLFEDEIILEVY